MGSAAPVHFTTNWWWMGLYIAGVSAVAIGWGVKWVIDSRRLKDLRAGAPEGNIFTVVDYVIQESVRTGGADVPVTMEWKQGGITVEITGTARVLDPPSTPEEK